jgi:hypothetical protein
VDGQRHEGDEAGAKGTVTLRLLGSQHPASLVAAAVEAGFSDHAHMARLFAVFSAALRRNFAPRRA